jgi:cytosine/adenosine deaminase-related metal-dependent hydrolase
VHSAGSLLTAATAHGHGCLGWDDAGSIAVGAHADLVTISLNSPRTAGAGAASVLEAVVFAASAADVVSVVVDGRSVVAAGQHVAIDVGRELDASIRELMGD